jgi:hypothetical protein
MKPLKEFSIAGFMLLWHSVETYQQLAQSLTYRGYKATPDSARRRVRQILRQQNRLPTDRRPTAKDYQRVKIEYMQEWRDTELL